MTGHEVKMALTTERIQVPRDEAIVARRAWYLEVAERLDTAGDDVMVQLSQIWDVDAPARFVWIDRHLRVWRVDKLGRVRSEKLLQISDRPRRVTSTVSTSRRPRAASASR